MTCSTAFVIPLSSCCNSAASLPSGLGTEAAGVVEAIGPGVTDAKVGDRVAYSGGPQGAYSEERVMPAERLVVLPDGISDQQAAAMMLKGMTAQYLIRQTYNVKEGDTILFHAAAGGVGLIACQWAKSLGATVIGTVGSDEKAELAKAHGCDHTVLYTRENFVERVREITNGAMVPVVYDSVGKDTFSASLDCLAPRGLMVLFGQSSGAVEPLNLGLLAQKGSLYVTRPTLRTYADKRADLLAMAQELFDVTGCHQGTPGSASSQDHRIDDPDRVAVRLDGWITPRQGNEACGESGPCTAHVSPGAPGNREVPGLFPLGIDGFDA
jgi:NADPH2:quinone reductase